MVVVVVATAPGELDAAAAAAAAWRFTEAAARWFRHRRPNKIEAR